MLIISYGEYIHIQANRPHCKRSAKNTKQNVIQSWSELEAEESVTPDRVRLTSRLIGYMIRCAQAVGVKQGYTKEWK